MEQTQPMIMQQLTALSERHPVLGRRLAQAAHHLLHSGTPLPEGLLAELVKYNRDFNHLQEQLNLENPTQPHSEISLKEIEQMVQTKIQNAGDKTVTQNALNLLEDILNLTHKEQENYQPLQTIKQRAHQLKTLIVTATDSIPEDTQDLASGEHPFSALLTLIEQQDQLSDSQWVVLEEKVAAAFGKPIAIAISRGKICLSSPQPQPQPQPQLQLQPQSLNPDIVILEEPTLDQSQDVIIVPSLEIPQSLPQVNHENIVFGNAPLMSSPNPDSNPKTIGLNVTVYLQGLDPRQFSAREYAGTRGQGRRLEAFQIALEPDIPGLSLQYMAHISNLGDTPMIPAGERVGEPGQDRQIEGFAIALTGPQASNYDVFYNAHIQNLGDVSPCSNGQYCGTRSKSLRVEGITIWIQPK